MPNILRFAKYYSFSLVGSGFAFASTPFIIKFLSLKGWGVFSVSQVILAVGLAIEAGFNQVILSRLATRRPSTSKNDTSSLFNELHEVYYTLTCSASVFLLPISFILFFRADLRGFSLVVCSIASSLAAILSIYISFLKTYSICNGLVAQSNYISSFLGLGKYLSLLFVAWWSKSPEYCISIFLMFVVLEFILRVHSLKLLPFFSALFFSFPLSRQFIHLLSREKTLIISAFLGCITLSIDRILVFIIAGPVALGSYQILALVAGIFSLCVSPLVSMYISSTTHSSSSRDLSSRMGVRGYMASVLVFFVLFALIFGCFPSILVFVSAGTLNSIKSLFSFVFIALCAVALNSLGEPLYLKWLKLSRVDLVFFRSLTAFLLSVACVPFIVYWFGPLWAVLVPLLNSLSLYLIGFISRGSERKTIDNQGRA